MKKFAALALALACLGAGTSAQAGLLAVKRVPDGSAIRLLDVAQGCKAPLLRSQMVLAATGQTIEGCWLLDEETGRFLILWQGAPSPRAYGMEEFERPSK